MATDNNFYKLTGERWKEFMGILKGFFWKKTDVVEAELVEIDEVPTANSTNLVTSGGVKAYIDNQSGGSEVKYTPQTLTEPQQMQARKNQGLYYSEGGGGDVTLTWDGDTTGLETIGGLYRLSEDAPLASEVKSVSAIQNGVEQTYEVGVSPAQIVEVEGGYAIGSLVCLVITADEVSVQGTTYTKGIWFVYGNTNNRTSQLVYSQTETIHHIEPKYIEQATEEGNMDVRRRLGLYYEDEGIVEKTANAYDYIDENGMEVLFSTYYTPAGAYGRYLKFTDDVITLDTLVSYGDEYSIYTDLSNLRIFTALETASVTIKYIASVYEDGGQEVVDSVLFYVVEGEFHSSGEDYLTITDPTYGERTLYDAEQGTYVQARFDSGSSAPDIWESIVTYTVEGMVPHCIEPKYIKDMYYEAEGIGAKTVLQAEDAIGDRFSVGGVDYMRRSEDVITENELISVNIGEYGEEGTEYLTSDYAISINQLTDLPILECYPYGMTGQKEKFYIVTEDTTYNNTDVAAGVYLPTSITIGTTYVFSVTFKGTTMITHPVPSKYLPITKTLDSESTDEQIPSAKTVYEAIPDVSGKENTSNKVTVLSIQSTNTQYPSAKSVYDFVKPQSQSSIPAGGLQPGILYNLSVLTGSVTIDLATPADANVANEYAFTFTAGSPVPSITWPASIIGWGGTRLDTNGQPQFVAGNIYEVSIRNNIGAIMEIDLSEY